MNPKKRPQTEWTAVDQDGFMQFRDPTSKTPFNPAGITLAVIDKEIEFAKIRVQLESAGVPIDRVSGDSIQMWVEDSFGISHVTGLGINMENLSPDRLIRDTDTDTARQLADCPILLLMSPEHQDAVCRWLYARHYAGDLTLKDKAGELIEKIYRKTTRGAPPKQLLSGYVLSHIYDDLMEYGRGVKNCIDQCQTTDELRLSFPDIDKLAELKPSIFETFSKRNIQVPAPSDMAADYLGRKLQLSSTQLYALMQRKSKSPASC